MVRDDEQRIPALKSGRQQETLRARVPLADRQFAVMRRADGGKVILRIDSVRVFEEVPAALRGD